MAMASHLGKVGLAAFLLAGCSIADRKPVAGTPDGSSSATALQPINLMELDRSQPLWRPVFVDASADMYFATLDAFRTITHGGQERADVTIKTGDHNPVTHQFQTGKLFAAFETLAQDAALNPDAHIIMSLHTSGDPLLFNCSPLIAGPKGQFGTEHYVQSCTAQIGNTELFTNGHPVNQTGMAEFSVVDPKAYAEEASDAFRVVGGQMGQQARDRGAAVGGQSIVSNTPDFVTVDPSTYARKVLGGAPQPTAPNFITADPGKYADELRKRFPKADR